VTAKTHPSPFEQCLLASGLVTPERLAELRQQIGQGVSDRKLADRLIALGLLNEWQVEQLREGKTKFTLGQYSILDAVAKGGMGHVFKGEHQLLGRVEAIKVLPRSRSRPEAIASFRHEIRAQAQLNHPNLVRVSYADRDGDTYFLVTEFVPGVDLRRLVRRGGPLAPDAAAWVVLQAAQGLEYAHRRGIVHRDVKPGNLLVTHEGDVKLADLGLAWYLNREVSTEPDGRKKIVGTCDYLAPEAINDPTRIVPVSDVYALGCTLYYAVTGKVPYPGGNAVEKMRRCLRDPPLPAQSIRPDLPENLLSVINQMMDKDLGRRTPTAAVAIELLKPLVNDGARGAVARSVEHYQEVMRARRAHHSPSRQTPREEINETLSDSADNVSAEELGDDSSGALSTGVAILSGSEPGLKSEHSTADFVWSAEKPQEVRATPLDFVVWGVAIAALLATLGLVAAALLGLGLR
jgi:serine/threonine protein kinase